MKLETLKRGTETKNRYPLDARAYTTESATCIRITTANQQELGISGLKLLATV
jgi:hypothetical protein